MPQNISREFQNKRILGLCRCKVVIDYDTRRITFERCVRTRSLITVFPLKVVECSWSDVWKVEKSAIEDIRIVKVTLPAGDFTFSDDQWPEFYELLADLEALENRAACPTELQRSRPDPVGLALITAFVLFVVSLVVVTFLN